MKKWRRISAGLLMGVFLIGAIPNSALAAPVEEIEAGEEATGEEEMTEAEKKEEEFKKLLDETYKMPVQSNEVDGWPKGPGTYGTSAIVMEAESGAILYAKSIDEQAYPASITKLLTALLAFEHMDSMDDEVEITKESVDCLKSGYANMNVKAGDVLTMEQALHGMLLSSANEVSYAIAESIAKKEGGDYEDFLDMMNDRVKELGGKNSNFENPNGMHDPKHKTTARDMALISKELFRYPEFFEISHTPMYKIPASDECEEHEIYQKHRMMIDVNANYYDKVIGGKTGYTPEALNTLVTMAEDKDMKLICVVMGTQPGYVYKDTRALLDYGFDNFHKVDVRAPKDAQVVLPVDVKRTNNLKKKHEDGNLNYYYGKMLVGSYQSKKKDFVLGEAKGEEEEKPIRLTPMMMAIFVGAAVLLVILILLLVRALLRSRKRAIRRKKIRKAKKRKNLHKTGRKRR